MALQVIGLLHPTPYSGIDYSVKKLSGGSGGEGVGIQIDFQTSSGGTLNFDGGLAQSAPLSAFNGKASELSLTAAPAVANSGYYFTGWTAVSGCTLSSTGNNDTTLVIFNSITSYHCVVKANFASSAPSYTACGKPTYVYMTNNGVDYSSTNNNADCPLTVGVTNAIKWSGASGGTNNSINGYGVTEDGSAFGGSTYTNQHVSSTSTSGSFNTSYTSGGVGKKYKATVRTEGTAGSSYYSPHSTSYVNIVPVSAITNYTITFNANSGSVSPSSKSGAYGGTMSLPTPTRSGYKFLGWYYNHDATSANIINLGKSYKYSGQISMSFWTYMSDYTANSTGNEKHIVSCEEASGYGFYQSNDGAYMVWEVRDGSAYKNVKKATSGVSAGYHFWNCIFTGSGKQIQLYMDGALVGTTTTTNTTINYNANTVTFSGCDPDSTYTAPATGNAWTGRVGNLVITNDAAIRSYEETINTISVPNQNATVYALWQTATTIQYNVNSGSITTGSGTTRYRVSSNLVQVSSNSGSSWSNLTSSIADAEAYYDLWNVGTYGATRSHYYFGSATADVGTAAYRVGSISGTIVGQDSSTASSTNPASWSRLTGISNPTLYQMMAARTVTLYINWVARTTYTVSYNKGSNGTGTNTSATKYHGETLTLLGATFTRTGYTQTGWATSDGGSKAYNLSASYTTNAATTLYPFWTANTYTVTLDQQSGSGGTTSVTATYGSAMPTATMPSRTGYTFGGYYDGTGGSGTQYYTAAGASARTWNKTAATTLYAKWTAKTYTVTVNLNGGTGGPGSSFTATYGTNKSLTAPTKAGYDFVGWACVSGSRLSQDFSAVTGFFTATPTKYIYGSSGTNNSTLSLVTMDTGSGFAASGNSAKMLRIVEPGTSTRAVGYSRSVTGSVSTAYLLTFVAKAPAGTYFIWASNTVGTGGSHSWLTSPAGTGKWETYAIKVTYGTGTVSSCGYITAGGNSQNVSGTITPNAGTVDYAWHGFGLYTKFNGACTYVPADVSSDTIYAIWIPKSYSIAYTLNGGTLSSGQDTIYAMGTSATSWIEPLNPNIALYKRVGYPMGTVNTGTGKSRANYLYDSDGWMRVERPTKAASVSSTTTTITTSFSAASSVNSITNTKTVTTTTPQNFYSWTITGMDSCTHSYWGRASSGITTNSRQTFTSTSITVTGNNYTSGAPPLEYTNLRQSAGTVTFTAGWTNGTATSTTTYTTITLPTVPSKSNTTDTITRTVNYNANGGTGTTTAQTVSPTAPITWTDDDKWYTASSGGTAAGTQGASYQPTASATLYAHYTGTTGSYNSPTIALRAALSKASTSSTTSTTITTSFSAASAVGSITSTKTVVTTQPYNFNGWALGSAAGTTYAAGATFTPTTGSTTFYATWSNGTATSATTYSSITLPTVPAKSNTTATTTNSISFDVNGGTGLNRVLTNTGTATVTWSDDDKWYTASSGGTGYAQGLTTYQPTSSATLYAHYTASTGTYSYTSITTPTAPGAKVTTSSVDVIYYTNYHDNGGDYADDYADSIDKTTTYTFGGWSTNASATSGVSAGSAITPTASTTYYATWSNPTYTYQSITLLGSNYNAHKGEKIMYWYNPATGEYIEPGSSYTPTGNVNYIDLYSIIYKVCYVYIQGTVNGKTNAWHAAVPYVYRTESTNGKTNAWHRAEPWCYVNSWR